MNDYDRFELLCMGVRRSIRYHDHLERTYDMLHSWGRFLTLFFSGSSCVLFSKSHPELGSYCTLLTEAISAAELALGWSKKARLHNDLKRRFCALEIDLCPLLDTKPNTDIISALECKRLGIEADEPPVKRAMNILCHNELCVADGRLHDLYISPRLMRLLAPYCEFAGWTPVQVS